MAPIQFRNFRLAFQRISSDVSFLRPLCHKIENFGSYVEKLQRKKNCGTGAYRGPERGGGALRPTRPLLETPLLLKDYTNYLLHTKLKIFFNNVWEVILHQILSKIYSQLKRNILQ
jgi:hypothetical protein